MRRTCSSGLRLTEQRHQSNLLVAGPSPKTSFRSPKPVICRSAVSMSMPRKFTASHDNGFPRREPHQPRLPPGIGLEKYRHKAQVKHTSAAKLSAQLSASPATSTVSIASDFNAPSSKLSDHHENVCFSLRLRISSASLDSIVERNWESKMTHCRGAMRVAARLMW